jgi:hypothetical protein
MIEDEDTHVGHAAALFEQALAYCTNALNTDPGNLKLREQTADAALSLAYFASSPTKSRDAERIAREHYGALIAMNPDDPVYRVDYAMAHTTECWYLYNHGSDIEGVRRAFGEYLALLDSLPAVVGKGAFNVPWQWTWITSRMWLAALASWAGKPTEARREIEQAQLRFADYCSRFPKTSFERCYTRVKFLSLEEYVLYYLRDWPAMAGAAQDCLAEIDAGFRQEPTSVPLLLRQADANAFLAVAAQHEGRPAEAIDRLRPAIETMRSAPYAYSESELHSILGIAQRALIESFVQLGDLENARRAAEQLLLGFEVTCSSWLPEQDWDAGALTLAASLCDSSEALRSIGFADRARAMLTSPDAAARLSVDGKENLAIIARLQAKAAASLSQDALERTGQELEAEAARDPEASERFTRAGEAAWNFVPDASVISSPDARQAELAAREGYRRLMARYPDIEGYRFLFAETYRMECYVHFGWDGQVQSARAAFRQYDELLQPFVGRRGYDSVRRTRLSNSLNLAQLAASVGDTSDADHWLEEARSRFETYLDGLPKQSPDRGLALVRFLEDSAWSAWWLRDWPRLTQLAQKAKDECELRLKEKPANEELLRRRGMAEDFAALAMAGAGQSAEASTRFRAASNRFKTPKGSQFVYGVWDSNAVDWANEYAWIGALRKTGHVAQAKRLADDLLWAHGQWVPSFPDYWRAQKHLAGLRILSASFLDPAVPIEAGRRKELLDQAAAVLAPENVASRLTVDVREALGEIERLQGAKVPPSQ